LSRLAWLVVPVLVACGVQHGVNVGLPQGPFIAGFNPPAVQPGYTRFITPTITGIAPGTDETWCQWLQAPLDHDVDVLNFQGLQSKGGHHVVLYANSATAPVGSSHKCTSTDMLSVRFLAGAGAEGTSLKLPAGVVMRLPAGQSLMANTHFINATSEPLNGQAVVDVQFADPDPSRQVAAMFSNVNTDFSVPPFTSVSQDATCVVQKDMNFFAAGDHMHKMGTSMYTELLRQDGTSVKLVQENIWIPEFEFNPTFSSWPLDGLLSVKAGDTIHSRCTWNNTTSETLTFPSEMCVAVAFYLPGGSADEFCVDSRW
jgi:hypothetical protein